MSILGRFKSQKKNVDDAPMESASATDQLAIFVADAWREGDADILRPALSENFTYISVAISSQMPGAEAYLDYLAGKFRAYRNNGLSFDPQIIDNEDPDIIIIKLDDNSWNPPVLYCHINGNKLDWILMRPETMVKLQDLNDPETFDTITDRACSAIHRWVESEVARLGFGEDDFSWIQKYPVYNAPAFQHICFRLGKSVFSLVINLFGQYQTREAGLMMTLPNVLPENQLNECSNNDLIACDIYIDVNLLTTPTLCYAGKTDMVDLEEEARKGSGIMSEWEINALAINFVVNHITKDPLEYLNYTNVLTIVPQIRYAKDGQQYFIYVDGHPAGVNVRPLNTDQIDYAAQNGREGQFADVGMCILKGNNGDFNDTILYRSNSICSNFRELMPIEEAKSRFGSYNGGCHPIT